MTTIKFIKNIGPYTPNDRAGFDADTAKVYLDLGVAELDTPAATAEVSTVEAGEEVRSQRRARGK